MSAGLAVLGTLLWVLLWILVGLLGLLAILVVVPLRFRASGQVGDEVLDGSVAVDWALGLIGFRLQSGRGAGLYLFGLRVLRVRMDSREQRAEKKIEKKAKKAEKKAARKEEGGAKSAAERWDKLRDMLQYQRTARRILRRLLGTLALRLRLRGELGADDPELTLSTQLLLDGLVARAERAEIDVEFNYLDEVIELEGDLQARLWLAHLLAVAVVTMFERDTWALLRAARA